MISLVTSSLVPVAPVNRQYSSTNPGPGSPFSYPHVALALIFRPFAKLNVGGVKTCPVTIKIGEKVNKIA